MIKEINCEFDVLNYDEESKISINKKNIKMDFFDDELVLNVIDKKFNKKYLNIINMLDEDDDSESEKEIILEKIDDLKRLIIDKYYNYLDKKTLTKYLKMIVLLENKISLTTRKSSRGR